MGCDPRKISGPTAAQAARCSKPLLTTSLSDSDQLSLCPSLPPAGATRNSDGLDVEPVEVQPREEVAELRVGAPRDGELQHVQEEPRPALELLLHLLGWS